MSVLARNAANFVDVLSICIHLGSCSLWRRLRQPAQVELSTCCSPWFLVITPQEQMAGTSARPTTRSMPHRAIAPKEEPSRGQAAGAGDVPRQHDTPGQHVKQETAYSRKLKSLGLLSSRFVRVYGQREGDVVCLDAAASRLQVERRRIYDIVNVLESVGVVARKAKNRYVWKSTASATSKIEELRNKASRDCFGTPEDFRKSKKKPRSRRAGPETPISSQETDVSTASAGGSRKAKSLGVLSQRFVQLFLLAGEAVVSLEQAALQLMGQAPSDSEVQPVAGEAAKVLKTKVRRLYDVANILSSLSIIEKVHTQKRKPAFRWVGIKDDTFSPRRLSVKRVAMQESTPPGSALKRPKCFSSPSSGFLDESLNSSLSPASVSLDKRQSVVPKPDAVEAPTGETEAPFDADTLEKLRLSLDAMPTAFAEQWGQWVSQAQLLVKSGVMSVEDAEKGIVALLGPRNSDGEFNARLNGSEAENADEGDDEQQLETAAAVDSKADEVENGAGTLPVEAEDDSVADGTVVDDSVADDSIPVISAALDSLDSAAGHIVPAPSAGADSSILSAAVDAAVHSAAVNAVPVDATDVGTSAALGDLPTAGAEDSRGVSMPAVADSSFEWMNQEYIDSYMQQAKAAGPEFVAKAEAWLQQLRQWQKTWDPFRTTVQECSGAPLVNPDN